MTLQAKIDKLAVKFAVEVFDAIRECSLEELGGTRVPTPHLRLVPPPRKTGRLVRRSDATIGKVVTQIVTLVKANKGGLRAEDIRTRLGLRAKEMPKPLKVALASKQLRKTGEKRATVYLAGK
jgi:hypothetical protein